MKHIKLYENFINEATYVEGDSDRGIGMEWTLGNGEVIYGPDFGVAEDVKSALKSLDKFFKEFEKSFSSLSREDKDYVVVNFD